MDANDILKLKRSDVRYWLYRIRTAFEKKEPIPEEALPFKEYYEKQKGFCGWDKFAMIWDIGEQGQHHLIIRRAMTEVEEWEGILRQHVREFPVNIQFQTETVEKQSSENVENTKEVESNEDIKLKKKRRRIFRR